MRATPSLLLSVALVSALSACGGGQSPAATSLAAMSSPETPAEVPSGLQPDPLYAALFESGRQWTYTAQTETSFWDDSDPAADESGNVTTHEEWSFTCTSTEVQRTDWAVSAYLDCGGRDACALEGYYLATSSGLYRVTMPPASPEELASLTDRDRLFSSPPEAASQSIEEDIGGASWTVDRHPSGDWCVGEEVWGGDESAWAVCVHDGIGITAASLSFAGGQVRDTTMALVPAP